MLCEAAQPGGGNGWHFLETFFTVQHDHIDFRLKNVNEGEVKKVWRYQAWDSYSPNEQKWRTLVATWHLG